MSTLSSTSIAAALAFTLAACGTSAPAPEQVEIGSRTLPVLNVDGLQFRDLNRNGALDA